MTQIQLLDDLEAEFARVASRPPRPAPLRALAIALGALVLLAGVAYSVPPTRAALDDITGSFESWVGGDEDQPPGRALRPGDDAPDWVRETGGRLIAENAGVGLYVTRRPSGDGTYLEFWLGRGMGMGDTIEGWRKRFAEHAVFVLGPSIFGGQRGVLDDQGRVPLFGVTGRSVERVELRYASGPPLFADGIEGGFVLLVDAWRPLAELIAFDQAGRELERFHMPEDLRYLCDKEPGVCP